MNAIGRRAELACRLAEMRRLGEQITRNPISMMAAPSPARTTPAATTPASKASSLSLSVG
jgi:hypothetical protein